MNNVKQKILKEDKNMKKFKTLLIVVMVLVTALVATLALVGCDKGNYLKVATEAGFAPFEYMDKGEIVGFDIDLIDAVAKKIGYKGVKVESMKFTSVIPSVQKGNFDVAIAGLTITEERKQQVAFSDTYINASQTIIYKGEKKEFADEEAIWEYLKGKKIGVVTGFSGDIMITDAVEKDANDDNPYDGKLKNSQVRIERYQDAGTAANALSGGSDIDVLVLDYDPAKFIASKINGLNASDVKIGDEQYAIAVSKDNEDLLKQINQALAELKADGTYDRLKEKYFG